MKKIFRVSAVLLAAVLACCALLSCSAPSLDSAKAAEALEAADYTVSFAGEDLIGSYREDGLDLDQKLMGVYSVRKENSKEWVTQYVAIYYFPDVENAKAAMERVSSEAANEKTAEHPDWTDPVRVANIIYYGTAAAIEAAK